MGETSFEPAPDTRRAFRDALGCYATGVAVVTAGSAKGPLGMTANSFASVSLDPPLVLWSPSKSSARHAAFVNAQCFAIHVMGEHQHETAVRFARNGWNFVDGGWERDASGVPILADCLARFDCLRHAVHDGGDHSIVVGRVVHVSHRKGRGLIFKRGQYGGFAGL